LFLSAAAVLDLHHFARVCYALVLAATGLRAGGDAPVAVLIPEPSADRWMYFHNGTAGSRATASTFSALPLPAGASFFADRAGQFIIRFNTIAAGIPAGMGPENYDVGKLILTAVIAENTGVLYDPTSDPPASHQSGGVEDPDPGRPIEIHGTGFRGGFTATTFQENSPFGMWDPAGANAFALGFDPAGAARDVSNNVTDGFEPDPWAIGTVRTRAPGDSLEIHDKLEFRINLALPGVADYVRQSLNRGFIWLTITSLHSTTQQGGSGYPVFFTREHPEHLLFQDVAATMEIEYALPLRIASFSRESAGGAVSLAWNGSPGFRYTVETQTGLSESDWTPLGTFTTAVPAPLTWSGVSTVPRAFFRITRTSMP
jgi:hypothetical protein